MSIVYFHRISEIQTVRAHKKKISTLYQTTKNLYDEDRKRVNKEVDNYEKCCEIKY